MSRTMLAVLAVATLLVPADTLADGARPRVSIQFSAYAPATIAVLVGDTVSWSNDSTRNHTVSDDATAYDSGILPPTYTFAHRFDAPGAFPYHCRLHPYIRGAVDVEEVLLDEPQAAAQAGRPFPLRGRTALGPGITVSIEVDDGSGAGYRHAAEATAGPDGSFTALVTPTTSGSYRAVAGDRTSPPIQLLVLNHSISARVRRGHSRSIVSVRVTPADPGATVVLQLKLRERFGWWPVARAVLDAHSRSRFVLRLRRPVFARVLLTLPDGATPLATSPTVRAGSHRRDADARSGAPGQ